MLLKSVWHCVDSPSPAPLERHVLFERPLRSLGGTFVTATLSAMAPQLRTTDRKKFSFFFICSKVIQCKFWPLPSMHWTRTIFEIGKRSKKRTWNFSLKQFQPFYGFSYDRQFVRRYSSSLTHSLSLSFAQKNENFTLKSPYSFLIPF